MCEIRNMVAITPSDTKDNVPDTALGLYVSGAGNLNIDWYNDTTTIVAVVAGDHLPWKPKRIRATSTTATVFGYY